MVDASPCFRGLEMDEVKEKVQLAKNAGIVKGVLWHQGEYDNAAGTSAEDYASRLSAIISQSRTDAGWDVPWGVALAGWYEARAGNPAVDPADSEERMEQLRALGYIGGGGE